MNSVKNILFAELGDYPLENPHLTFEELGVDSFDLLSTRIALEQFLGGAIDDGLWTSLATPADVILACCQMQEANGATAERGLAGAASERRYVIGMPQMALRGLSESWLFKEIGDFHWQLITDGLGTSSSQLVDGNGDRLYATFTRIRISADHPLRAFRENEHLTIRGSCCRYGAGMFLGDFDASAGSKRLRAEVLSSFAKRDVERSNKGLLKGQPEIPENCPIPEITEKPPFVEEYRERRNAARPEPLFRTAYRVNPYHDVNGVGLLYFAAYPTIGDTCELDYMGMGNSWAERSSTFFRDICYFANSDLDDVLEYEVQSRQDQPGSIEIQALISRATDKAVMASIISRKSIDFA